MIRSHDQHGAVTKPGVGKSDETDKPRPRTHSRPTDQPGSRDSRLGGD